MRFRKVQHNARWGIAALAVIALAACDWNDPDEIQNSSNFAVVRAQFFASSASRTPVSGVRMIVEADAESERPYNGPDVTSISGQDGVAVAKVFTGLTQQQQQQGGGQQTPTGPRNPLELPAPLFFGDAAVTLIYNGQIVSLIGGGLTIGNGKIYDLGTVFLSDFGVVAD
jgi:hypothetical protein